MRFHRKLCSLKISRSGRSIHALQTRSYYCFFSIIICSFFNNIIIISIIIVTIFIENIIRIIITLINH